MSLANRKTKILVAMLSLLLVIPMTNAFAMHIMEGYLPPNYCIIWGVVCIPFLIAGGISMQKQAKKNNKTKILLALAGAFVFILSSLKIPSVTGSCSHPTGTGLGAILFGPSIMSLLGIIVLLFHTADLQHLVQTHFQWRLPDHSFHSVYTSYAKSLTHRKVLQYFLPQQ